MRFLTASFIFTASLFFANSSHAIYLQYANIVGETQGVISDKASVYLDTGFMLNLGVSTLYERDAASGLPTGKRQHRPIKIVKEWGPSSPMLRRAYATHELLDIELVSVESADSVVDNNDSPFLEIKLENVHISSIGPQRTIMVGKRKVAVEDVSFTFQKIEFEHKLDEKDSWITQ